MSGYQIKRKLLNIALITAGMSLGAIAIEAQDIESLPFEPIPFEPIEPILIEPFSFESIPIEPIEPIETIPLTLFPLEPQNRGTAPIYHIVLVDLIDTVTEAEIEALIADGEHSISSIPGVCSVDIGLKLRDDRDVHIGDYDLAVYVQLGYAAALDAYGSHPNHQAFLERQRHLWSSIRVIDFSGSAPSTIWNDCQ
jgi:hypothetical protein